jgi:hypothetical protein
MQALIMRAYHLGVLTSRQRGAMFARMSQAGYRLREPENLDPPVEKPQQLFVLAQYFLEDMKFSKQELMNLLDIGEADFWTYYRDPNDILSGILGMPSLTEESVEINHMPDEIMHIDVNAGAPPLHRQINCHPEDVSEFQRMLDSLHFLQRTRVIPEGIVEVGEERVRKLLHRKLEREKVRYDDVDDLPF